MENKNKRFSSFLQQFQKNILSSVSTKEREKTIYLYRLVSPYLNVFCNFHLETQCILKCCNNFFLCFQLNFIFFNCFPLCSVSTSLKWPKCKNTSQKNFFVIVIPSFPATTPSVIYTNLKTLISCNV